MTNAAEVTEADSATAVSSAADLTPGDPVIYCGSYRKYLNKRGTVISVSPISCMVKFDDGVQFGVLHSTLEREMPVAIAESEIAEAEAEADKKEGSNGGGESKSGLSLSPLQSVLQAALLRAVSAPGCTTLREKVDTLWTLGMRNQADIARVLSQDPDCWQGVTRERVRQILGDKVQEHKESLPKTGTHRDPDDTDKPLDVTIHLRLSRKQLQNYKTSADTQKWPSLNHWIREVLDASSKIQALGVDPLKVLRGRIADGGVKIEAA